MHPNSIEAYRHLEQSGKLNRYQFATLKHIILNPDCTQNDIRDVLSESHRKRVRELEDMELVGSRTYCTNGRKYKHYSVTGRTEIKEPIKGMSLRMKYSILLGVIRETYRAGGLDWISKGNIKECFIRIGEKL